MRRLVTVGVVVTWAGATFIAWWIARLSLPVAIAFFLFEVLLIATLQAFIFATLTAIYLGGATAESH